MTNLSDRLIAKTKSENNYREYDYNDGDHCGNCKSFSRFLRVFKCALPRMRWIRVHKYGLCNNYEKR
jgi:hypothetical protein